MSRRLKALRVGNFKAFADAQTIPVKPITLVFGPNSAGKSSFIHSLALAHEAEFGRKKPGRARLDVRHTEVGGSAIDLGGYRQFVHRGQLDKGVEWGAVLNVSELGDVPRYQQLRQLLSGVNEVALIVTLGMELDNEGRPLKGAEPHISTMEVLVDDVELLRMSRRPADADSERFSADLWRDIGTDLPQTMNRVLAGASEAGITREEVAAIVKNEIKKREGEIGERALQTLRIDRLNSDHGVLSQVIEAIVETNTFALSERKREVDEALGALLSRVEVQVDHFLPSSVVISEADSSVESEVSKALAFWLPKTLNDLIKGIADVFAWELNQLQYLGPLRSFPARHLAHSEHEDSNWYAGGGYAWDVVRRNSDVRKAVNAWLGSDKLKTPYELRIKELVNLEQVRDIQVEASDSWEFGGEEIEGESIESAIKDDFENYSDLLVDNALNDGRIDRVNELVLMDMRSRTAVTHRDVGIGISQVLPVLVMAYASRGKLLAMEQPEIHLHPSLQAELGDVFIESALGGRRNTFILETHSEHLILRLLRRMREGKLSADDISVLYVQPAGVGSQVLQIRVDEDGDFIDRWPGGFFEESFQEREAGR